MECLEGHYSNNGMVGTKGWTLMRAAVFTPFPMILWQKHDKKGGQRREDFENGGDHAKI